MTETSHRLVLRLLNIGAFLVFALSAVLAVALLGWVVFSLATSPAVADPRDPATVRRGNEVIAMIRSGDLRPGLPYEWDVLGPDSHPDLTWAHEAVIRLPQEYRDLSFGGEVDATYFPGSGELSVTFYQDGGLFGPNRDQFLLYDSGDKGDWSPGPGGEVLADQWWYVADSD